MTKARFGLSLLAGAVLFAACNNTTGNKDNKVASTESTATFNEKSFADLQLLTYEVPGWDQLSLQQKQLAYYLYEASLAGRDIIYDQRGKYNLLVRKTLEAILGTYNGNKSGNEWNALQTYAGQIWFSNGLYHHYSNDKIMPAFSYEYFAGIIKNTTKEALPLNNGESIEDFLASIKPVIFDAKFLPKMKETADGVDHIAASANNFYEGVTIAEVEAFYDKFPKSDHEPEWGLNSKVVKENDKLVEKVWKSGGMYGAAIDKMIFWIEKAITVAENEQQAKALKLLVKYYKTGDLLIWDEYNIAWTKNTETVIDFTNGFIEVYNDAIGKKGSYESIVSIKDFESSKRIQAIANIAQWFEDNSPLLPAHKKKKVKGIDAKVINVIVEAGDAAPSTPIGINLPNSDWLRKEHGSKSVSLGNIVSAYNSQSAGSGFLEEFVGNSESLKRMKEHGNLASDLHTDMHECIGHASGQINPGIGTPDKTLKTYASTLEEARADLVALYYVLDPKLVEIGVMPSLEVGKAEYDNYMMNGLMTQLTRLNLGDKIMEDHMRNRALNAYWVYEKGKAENVVEFVKKGDKTYVQVNDYNKLRVLFGNLLREIQRIKSEGDYNAGKALVETYGVNVNQELHKEVLDRYAKLNVKPYKGFIQPKLEAVTDANGNITDVKLVPQTSFFNQMLEYGKQYGYLPVFN